MNDLIPEKPPEVRKLIDLAYLVVILAAFTWAKEFLLPLILAILISFLLAPIVSRLERWHFPRPLAVISIAGIAFVFIGGLCSTLLLEGLDLVNALPKYRDNIHARWVALQKGPPGPISLAISNVGSVIADLSKVSESAGGSQKLEPTKVQIVSSTESVFAILKNSAKPVIGPIGELAVVIVLVVFMLLERKRLCIRLLRLIGHSRITTTTLAVDEAGSRLSSFLFGQLMVNTGVCHTPWDWPFSNRHPECLTLGGSHPRAAFFALSGSLDLSLFSVDSVYCHLKHLERTDTDPGSLRLFGGVNEQRRGTFCLGWGTGMSPWPLSSPRYSGPGFGVQSVCCSRRR
jgi:hypothetical protein